MNPIHFDNAPAPPYQGVIFDMDGVLADTEPLWDEAMTELLAQRGIVYTAELREASLGRSSLELGRMLAERGLLSEELPSFSRAHDDLALRRIAPKVTFFPETLALVKALLGASVPVAVASSSPQPLIAAILGKAELPGGPPPFVSADSVAAGKPHPAVYQEAARLLSLPTSRCIAIEDSPAGVSSATTAGLFCIALTTSVAPRYLNEAALVCPLSSIEPTVRSLLTSPPSSSL